MPRAAKPKPSRSGPSGPTQSNAARRATGRQRLSVWLPEDAVERIDARAEEWEVTRTEALARIIRSA